MTTRLVPGERINSLEFADDEPMDCLELQMQSHSKLQGYRKASTMLSSAVDIIGDLISYLVWFVNGIQTGDPLFNFGLR